MFGGREQKNVPEMYKYGTGLTRGCTCVNIKIWHWVASGLYLCKYKNMALGYLGVVPV